MPQYANSLTSCSTHCYPARLSVYENMSASDVAEMLGLTVQNVYSNLSAAKRQLKESLAALMKHGADT
jgi:transposase